MSEAEARIWPDLMAIVEERVRPEREASLSESWSQDKEKRAKNWWQYSRYAKDLHVAIAGLGRVLVISRVGQHAAFTFLPNNMVYAESLIIFPFETYAFFCTLQSRIHEIWARFFASSMKDDLRYTSSDCFETFPLPTTWELNPTLEIMGKDYYEFRAALMVKNHEGLTKTYNRFHDPEENSPDILQLRKLHTAMDRAVLDAYGWPDIQTTYDFFLDYEEEEDEESDKGRGHKKKKPWRYRWPDDIRDEVLARLLALNAKRAEEERLARRTASLDEIKRKQGQKLKQNGSSDQGKFL